MIYLDASAFLKSIYAFPASVCFTLLWWVSHNVRSLLRWTKGLLWLEAEKLLGECSKVRAVVAVNVPRVHLQVEISRLILDSLSLLMNMFRFCGHVYESN